MYITHQSLQMHAHTTGTPSIQDGDSIDNYRVVGFISKGAGGEVYRAVSSALDQEVALKLLSTELSCSASLERAQNEARILAALNHPNVVRIYGMGMFKGRIYFVMSLIKGLTLAELLKRDGRLSAEKAIPMFIALADALAYLHSNGIIHRDLKPSNIVINEDGQPVLIDFGLAKADQSVLQHVTQQGHLKGTPQYMSPEVCAGESATKASDIYGFGCILYEALMGKPVFEGEHPIEVMMKHLRNTLPSLPVFCESVLRKCLAKNPADRYSDFDELKSELAQLRTDEGVEALQKKPLDRRRKLSIHIASTVAFCIVCLIGALVLMKFEPIRTLLSQVSGSSDVQFEGVMTEAEGRDMKATEEWHESGTIKECRTNRISAAQMWLKKHNSPEECFKAYDNLSALFCAEGNYPAQKAALHGKLNAALSLNKLDQAYPLILHEARDEGNFHALTPATIDRVSKVHSWFASQMRTDPHKASQAAIAALILARESTRNNNQAEARVWVDRIYEHAKFSTADKTYQTLAEALEQSRNAACDTDKLRKNACTSIQALNAAIDHGAKISSTELRSFVNTINSLRAPKQGETLNEINNELKPCFRKLKERSKDELAIYANPKATETVEGKNALRNAVFERMNILNTEASALIYLTDDCEAARQRVNEAIRLGQKHGFESTMVAMESQKSLSWIERLMGHRQAASTAAERALWISQEIGDETAIALSDIQVADDVQDQDPRRAVQLLENSYQLIRHQFITTTKSASSMRNAKTTCSRMLVLGATQLARAYLKQNRPDKALEIISDESELWKIADQTQLFEQEQGAVLTLKSICEQKLRKYRQG